MRFAGLILEHHSGRVARPREGIVEFSRQERAVFQRLNKIGDAPAVVYDIGASNGCWSVVVSDSLPPAEHHLFGPLCDHLIYSDILQRAAAIIPNRTCIGLGLPDRNAPLRCGSRRTDLHPTAGKILDIGDTPWTAANDRATSG